MANELHVDAAGLRVAAAKSAITGTTLEGAQVSSPTASRPSSAGVAVVNVALTSVRARQSARVTGQADDLAVGSARYDSTDTDGSDGITTVKV
ncbi:hypothetical protein ABQF34_06160 [Mycolicibacterium boenickei]